MSSVNLVPINLESEKKKFFFDPQYNPQFIYQQIIPDEILYGKYGEFEGELIDRATKICNTVIKKWGTYSAYLNTVEGRILTKEESAKIILDYLQESNLQKKVTTHFSSAFIPRTHVDGYSLNVRLPITYRENNITGILHHEIGTHVFRRINDELQLWHKRRNDFNLRPYLETEEGIALLHGGLGVEEPYFWNSGLHYFASYLAKTDSFSQVFEKLKLYLDDREERWYVTLRAKRGVSDTSRPGGYTKDQVYLRGVIKVTDWLRSNHFDIEKLYLGKVAIEDLPIINHISQLHTPSLPFFISNDRDLYEKQLKYIMKVNEL